MARREAELLARVPLFMGLSKRHLRSIASIGREETYGEGAVIAEEGKPGDDFYVLLWMCCLVAPLVLLFRPARQARPASRALAAAME